MVFRNFSGTAMVFKMVFRNSRGAAMVFKMVFRNSSGAATFRDGERTCPMPLCRLAAASGAVTSLLRTGAACPCVALLA